MFVCLKAADTVLMLLLLLMHICMSANSAAAPASRHRL